MLPGPGARRQPKRRPPSGWVIVVFVQICLFFYMYWQLRPNEQAATSFSEVQKPGEAEEPQRSSLELAEVEHEARVSEPSVLKTLAVNPWVYSSEQTRMGGIRIAFPTTGEPKVVMQTPAMEQPLSEEQAGKPFFSIVLAAYNQGAFLEETVGSVLAQAYSDWELIIVDDGSTDSTWPLASSLLDRHAGFRIRLLRKDNGGLADARNAGLRYARGSWLCMLDSDDLLGRSYLQEAAAFALEDARVDIVPGCMRNFDAVTGDWCFPEGWSVVGVSHWNKFHASVLMRRRLLEATGGYDPGLPWGLEDWNFWLSTIPHGPVVRFSATLTFHYRQHMGTSMRKEMFACCLEEVKAMVRTNHPELYEPQQLLQDHATIAAMRADTLQRLEAKLRLFPGLPKPFFWRALRLAAQGEADDAIRDLETAVRLSQESAAPQEMLSWQMHYHLALAHRSQGNLAAALHSVNQALKSAYFDNILHLKQQLEQQVLGAEPKEGRMALVPQYWQSEEARQHVLDGTVTSQLAQLAQLRASSQAASAQHRLLLTVLMMTQSQPCTRGRRLGDGVNMLQDGAFEGRGAWGKFGAGFQLVQAAGRPGGSGATVLKLENADEEQQRGAAQTVAVDQHEPAPLLIQAWSKADAVSGVAGSGYALYLDVTYADGSHEWSVTLQFDTGSHDWQHRQLLLQRDLPIRQLNVHCLLRGHAGTVWFDDVSIAALDQAVCRCALGQVFRPGGAGDCDQCPGGQMCAMGLVFDSPEPVRAAQGS